MLSRYSHVRMEAKRTAMEALAVSTKTAGYDTNRDTNVVVTSARPSQLRDLVDQNIASRNQIAPWLKRLDALRVAA